MPGDSYSGEWDDQNNRSGYGVQYWGTGAHYEGKWKSNFPHGYGRYHDHHGNTYEGLWKKGCRHGEGKYTEIKTERTITGMFNSVL